MEYSDLSEWHLGVLRDIIVLSVSNGPGAQELQSMMFYSNKSGPTDSYSYTVCDQMVVKI